MQNGWDDRTTMKFVCLLRDKDILWNEKNNSNDNQQLCYQALRDISKRMKSPDFSVTPTEVIKKIKWLKHIYSEEIVKIKRDSSYKPKMIWFRVIDKIFSNMRRPTDIEKGGKANPNTSEGESSNQSVTKGETGDGIEEIALEDMPTQLDVRFHHKRLSEAPAVLPDDDSSTFPRNDQCFQHPDETSFFNRGGEMDMVQDETSNPMDFPTGGIDDTLVSFGNYLVSLLRRLPLDKSYQLQQKFISETMNTTIQFEKDRTLSVQKRKNEVNQIHDRLYLPSPLGSRLEHSRVDGPLKTRISNRNNICDPFNQKIGEALRPNRVFYNSGGGHSMEGENRVTAEISVETTAGGVFEGSSLADDSRVMCVQCDVCEELFQTSAEMKRHHVAKHSGETNKSSSKEEVASKRPCLEDRGLLHR